MIASWFAQSTIALGLLSSVALAQCGPANSDASCPLNTCCSSAGYCGVTSAYCGSGCQSAYGSCAVPTQPSCATSGKSATDGRRVGYWSVDQAWDDSCDVVLPSQIQTSGMTHLILAFAQFDSGFALVPTNTKDTAFYTEFTALQSSSLQTWISIGGGDSPSPWSDMVADSNSRATFISSLESFLKNYSFQGVDLDWEFPTVSTSDGANFVSLVQELRLAFGDSYGISATLPADWGSISGFDPAGMASSVDFFNYMAYDIHGWGIDSGTDQKVVTYPASIVDIATDLLPLWADDVDPSLVNLGIPLYGRGYTLSSASCTTTGCAASGPSNSGSCVADTTGVMVLTDIKTAQSSNSAKVVLDSTAMQKYATWDSTQWMAYDDADTIALKLGWADGVCLGGLVFWALDDDGGAPGS
ncbi:glycoside hydrolase superfamily [Xylariales sp. PMI_506]|nr:glycoside hydrolase superfamily [Xylariales sp. PMI_506]